MTNKNEASKNITIVNIAMKLRFHAEGRPDCWISEKWVYRRVKIENLSSLADLAMEQVREVMNEKIIPTIPNFFEVANMRYEILEVIKVGKVKICEKWCENPPEPWLKRPTDPTMLKVFERHFAIKKANNFIGEYLYDVRYEGEEEKVGIRVAIGSGKNTLQMLVTEGNYEFID